MGLQTANIFHGLELESGGDVRCLTGHDIQVPQLGQQGSEEGNVQNDNPCASVCARIHDPVSIDLMEHTDKYGLSLSSVANRFKKLVAAKNVTFNHKVFAQNSQAIGVILLSPLPKQSSDRSES